MGINSAGTEKYIIYYLYNNNYDYQNVDANKAAGTNIKTNSIKHFLSIWVRNDSSNCIFNGHTAQEHKTRQNILILQNKNKIKDYD